MAKVDFEKLAYLIKECSDGIDILNEQNKIIQTVGRDLNDVFKDSGYSKYEAAFNEGDQNVKRMIEALSELMRAVALYGKKMAEEV